LDKFTRKELKTDKFAEEVKHSVAFVTSHSRQTLIYTGVGLAIVLAIAGGYYYRQNQHTKRQQALSRALAIHEAVVGPPAGADDPRPSFPTKEAKEAAEEKAFQDLIKSYPGSNEAAAAHVHLALSKTDSGKLDEAEKHLRAAVEAGDKEFASSANFTLAQLLAGQGKYAEAEKIFRALMESPTTLVSKEQATIELARVLGKTKPDEARKLLEPLQKDKNAVIARNAVAVIGELPAK
jgi:predicted negative regulator of RcsB-dependent stress response